MIRMPLLDGLTRLIGQGNFPTFNLADMCVVGGTITLLIGSFVMERRSHP